MSLIPDFELGIGNAWIFMMWPVLVPFLSRFIIKEKKVSERLRTSAPMKYEKLSNILSMVVLIAGFIYSIFLPVKFNTVWFYIGVLIFLFGLIFYATALFALRNATPDKPFTTGPYRYSRHPIYVALFLIYMSISLMGLSWVFLLITIISAFQFLAVAQAEERDCLKTYGKEYQEYMQRTPRWAGIPKPKGKQQHY